jgi:hypothetical protein
VKWRNYYRDLGVPGDATDEEIRAAFRKLSRKIHPDVNSSPDATARFRIIREAFEFLSDPDKRKEWHARVWARLYVDGADRLNQVKAWLQRFILVVDPMDYDLLALWVGHTFLAKQLYSTPRLRIDSAVYGAGKTTVLEHLSRLCYKPIGPALVGSGAMIADLVADDPHTLLLDEVDRMLAPGRSGNDVLMAVLNTGHRVGGVRLTRHQEKGGTWQQVKHSTFAPVAMSGNAPDLPADTLSREIRILLFPDLHGVVEESDWELIGRDADRLHNLVQAWTNTVKTDVKGLAVELPAECVGRAKEKWRPLKRIADAAGGQWPDLCDALIARAMKDDKAEREAGLKKLPDGMVLLNDLYAIWPQHDELVPSRDVVLKMADYNPEYWGEHSHYGKKLTEKRMAALLYQVAKVTSQRPGGRGPMGYFRDQFGGIWAHLGISPHRAHRDNSVHNVIPLPRRDDPGEQAKEATSDPVHPVNPVHLMHEETPEKREVRHE